MIENSIYHGIKEKQGEGLIKIKIKYQGSCLQIAVIDNGLGIKKDRLSQVKAKLTSEVETKKHIGLFNTNKRLILRY